MSKHKERLIELLKCLPIMAITALATWAIMTQRHQEEIDKAFWKGFNSASYQLKEFRRQGIDSITFQNGIIQPWTTGKTSY